MRPSQSRESPEVTVKKLILVSVVLQEITKMGRIRETRKGKYRSKEKWERNERDKERRGKGMRDRRGMKYKRPSENRGRRDLTEIKASKSVTCAGHLCNSYLCPYYPYKSSQSSFFILRRKKPCSVNAAPVLLETDLLLPSTWRPKHEHWNQVEKEQDKKKQAKKYLKLGKKNSVRD